MHPPGVQIIPTPTQPAPHPIPLITGKVNPRARKSWNHVYGQVEGGTLTYSDLNAFSWYEAFRHWRVIQMDSSVPYMGLHDVSAGSLGWRSD